MRPTLILFCVLALTAVATAGSGTVTVQLFDSGNNGLSGGNVFYYDGGWQSLGTTVNGTVSGTVPKTTDIEIRYSGGRFKWILIDPATNPTLTINTILVTVKLQTCSGTPLVGDAKYYFGGFTSIGNTPATIELLPYSALGPGQGNYDFQVTYDGRTSPIHTQDIAVNPVIVLTTTKVDMFGQNVYWYNNGWKPFVGPKEVMGGKSNRYGNTAWADFKFNYSTSPTVTIDIDGCSLTGGMITLVDENGSPIANYPADYPTETRNLQWKYRCGGSWGPSTSFKTDANGQTFFTINCPNNNWDNKITMTLNQTSLEQNVMVNSTFQAAKVNANLEGCTGPITDVPGGTVAQGGGYWYTHGTTGPSGKVSFYTFPGSIKVRMDYNHASETQYPVIASGANDVHFQTTKVTFNYAGDIKSNKGGSWWMFSKPTMYLLAQSYNFWFKTGPTWYGPVALNVSGCEMGKVLLRVLDENGNGVAGGKATPAFGGSWGSTLVGQTDANGVLLADILPGFTKIKMTVNQGSVEQSLAQLNASNYTWYTEILRIWLKDHAGSPITDQAGTLRQGGGSWYTWGNFNASGYRDIQLFATGSYKFEAGYNYTTFTDFPVVTAGAGIQNFDFQTGQIFGSCITQYSTGAWRTFTDGMELMPGTYTFRSPEQSGTVTAGGTTYLICLPKQSSGEFLTEFSLAQNYPNPFNPSTVIGYAVPEESEVLLQVFDMQGRLVATLVNGVLPPGEHMATFETSDLPGGNYMYRLQTNGQSLTRMMTLLK
ncbi:MAG: T9SS type A sorting domain-containing protein [Bacteroidetes bacterium]|nr:T9SS type A sorting domain-containing protein [Bacteroidota bacterium]